MVEQTTRHKWGKVQSALQIRNLSGYCNEIALEASSEQDLLSLQMY